MLHPVRNSSSSEVFIARTNLIPNISTHHRSRVYFLGQDFQSVRQLMIIDFRCTPGAYWGAAFEILKPFSQWCFPPIVELLASGQDKSSSLNEDDKGSNLPWLINVEPMDVCGLKSASPRFRDKCVVGRRCISMNHKLSLV